MSFFNRMGTSKNPYQGDMPRVLCVCSGGLLRSPTIAWVLSNEPYNCNTRAVGTAEEYALIPIDTVLVEWADIIVCANKDHLPKVQNLLKENQTPEKPLFNLDLPDIYKTRDPELVTLIKERLTKQGF